MTVILLTWFQIRLRPVFLVGRVGIFLALKTYRYLLGILDAVLAGDTCALEVAGIYLNTGFVGVHLKEDACYRRVE